MGFYLFGNCGSVLVNTITNSSEGVSIVKEFMYY